MAYCCLILIGKFIQKLVFGELRVSEQQHIKDKFWNFVFYKFIFIFGVMNVQYIEEVVLWCSWFSFLGFLHLLAQLCKDRFEYLSFSPTTPKGTHVRLLILLCTILTLAFIMVGISIYVGYHVGLNTFSFMIAECLLVTLRTLSVVVRYGIHLWDISQDGSWDKRATYIYYSELIFEMTVLVLDFIHHFHMLLWGNIFLSMASLVILMQLRYLFYEIRHRLRKYKNYLKIVRHMETTYPLASANELEENSDDCAICWDRMDLARKLPCGHLFHNSCLRSWLEQDISCPTCRKSLTEADSHSMELSDSVLALDDDLNRSSTRIFHFGTRHRWWPGFTVEVTNTNVIRNRENSESSNVENMAKEIQKLFPDMLLCQISEDLRKTHSMELTIENILDGKITEPKNNPAENRTSEGKPPERLSISDEASLPSKVVQNKMEENLALPSSSGLGWRFSKLPEEREVILSQKKDEMIESARRKYLNKLAVANSTSEKMALIDLEERVNRRRRSRNILCSLILRIREM
ncbi:E3 ubiquitin-protein ligase AMFR-like isoform X2 [Centruroides sculpturatus]|uniref:E3 ubiquitin-protein ligase AMFR-like isoform X2 n=1 Tax=Centruroides sculpturatus TaxID=218467 RepID=UPI000C6E6504|nr:E3 ubiquitin-protein ligase AMFR-like isoform X2 [Centruroides sculpturatus]